MAAPLVMNREFRGVARDYVTRFTATAASVGTVSGPIPVNGAQPKKVPLNLFISGDITGLAAGAPAAATVIVGSRAFTANVQGNQYSATINALSADDMVTVDVTSLRVHYRSIAGSFRRLKLRSGSDLRVELAEHRALSVSPLSTATAFLVSRVLGHEPRSDVEFERASRSLASRISSTSLDMVADVTTAAQTMHQIAVGDMALPAGFGDGLAFVQDSTAYGAYVGQWDEGNLTALDYPFIQNDFAPLQSLAEVPQTLLLTSAWATADVPIRWDAVQLLVKETANRYSFHENKVGYSVLGGSPILRTQSYEPSLTATGELKFTAIDPKPNELYNVDGTRVLRTVSSRTFRRLTVGAQFSLWASKTLWTDTNPAVPSDPPVGGSAVEIWAVADLDQLANRTAWTGLQGRRALPWFCMLALPNRAETALAGCEYPQHRFDTGGTGVTEDVGYKIDQWMMPKAGTWGQAFTWSVDSQGRLQVNGPDATTLFWNIDAGDAATDVVVYLTRNRTGDPVDQSLVGLTLAVSGDYVPLASQQVVGRWETGYSLGKYFSYPVAWTSSTIERLGDGTGTDYTNVPGLTAPYPNNWQVAGERVFDKRYRAKFTTAPSTRYVQNCEEAFAAGATGCSPYRVRYFRPLMRVGNRLYGIEEFYYQQGSVYYAPPGYTGTFNIERSGAGPAFYQCQDGACLTAFPAAAMAGSAPDGLDSRGLAPTGNGFSAYQSTSPCRSTPSNAPPAAIVSTDCRSSRTPIRRNALPARPTKSAGS
jgi:hypothetical protein